MGAACGRISAFSTYPAQISQIQSALIVSDPVQISQICDRKSPLSQPALIMSDPVRFPKFVTENPPSASLNNFHTHL